MAWCLVKLLLPLPFKQLQLVLWEVKWTVNILIIYAETDGINHLSLCAPLFAMLQDRNLSFKPKLKVLPNNFSLLKDILNVTEFEFSPNCRLHFCAPQFLQRNTGIVYRNRPRPDSSKIRDNPLISFDVI